VSHEPQIFTLKQVVSSIRKTIETRYNSTYWVKSEMHKLNKYPSGHCFPELLQKEEGKIVAQISGSIWKHNFERINQQFIQVVKEPLKEDTTLLMQVKISFHETYGLSLQILDIDPNFALGELQRERQETLKKLKDKGLINTNQTLDFPLVPKRVAVISAESSKGLSDFMQVLDKNEWGYSFFTMLFPSYVQGDMAAKSIVKQLEKIKSVQHHFDIVVIVRGGGGEVGLSCYNNYSLCEAIASFPLPVLTGIGHSTNMTVAEMISYRNAITPTELADFLIQAFHNFSAPVNDAIQTIQFATKALLDFNKNRLSQTIQSYQNVTQRLLVHWNHQLLRKGSDLKDNVKGQLNKQYQRLLFTEHLLGSESKALIQQKKNALNEVKKDLPYFMKTIFVRSLNSVEKLEQSVRLIDPINVLKRGYSITTAKGKTVNESNPVKQGDVIVTRTANYIIESEVKKKKDE
jgi:exodeoxyribonuclease VII large subunit